MSRETPDGFRLGGPYKPDDVTEDWDDDDSFAPTDPTEMGWAHDDYDDYDDE